MATIAQAVISREAGAPTRVEEMVVEDPGPGEVLVRIQASGVCHTDLGRQKVRLMVYKLGKINNDFPFLLGHEVAGIVESVGEGVESPAVGEYVVIAWRAPCGNCRFCAIGQPHLCSASLNAKPRMTAKSDGKQLSPALGIGGFARIQLCRQSRLCPCPGNARRSRPVFSAAGLPRESGRRFIREACVGGARWRSMDVGEWVAA